MYCTHCGAELKDSYKFCPACGCPIWDKKETESTVNNNYNENYNGSYNENNTSNVLGTLVAVTLLGGAIRNLYYRNGIYYYDRFCRRPYPMDMIMGPYHPHHHGIFGSPMFFGGFFGPHGGMGGGPGPHGGPGGGMFGGPHGGPGGGMFGGPHGGPGGGMFGGPHGGPGGGMFGGGHGPGGGGGFHGGHH